jgi:hypothetical protein
MSHVLLLSSHFSLSDLLESKPNDSDVDQLLPLLHNVRQDYSVSSSVLQAFHHLIQWTVTLALHLMTSVPEFKTRRGPGVS